MTVERIRLDVDRGKLLSLINTKDNKKLDAFDALDHVACLLAICLFWLSYCDLIPRFEPSQTPTETPTCEPGTVTLFIADKGKRQGRSTSRTTTRVLMLCENLYGLQSKPVDDALLCTNSAILLNKDAPLPARFRALFTLRNVNSDAAVEAIALAVSTTTSALLKHELAYCLGQMRLPSAINHLYNILANEQEDTMVRHEAGEALGAIGLEESIPVLQKFLQDSKVEVRETCEIAIDNIVNKRGIGCPCFFPGDIQFDSVDPASPLSQRSSVSELEHILMDSQLALYKRYQAMFSLRNRATDDAVLALCKGLADQSALFRHEIAYVLGQLQNPVAVDSLATRLAMLDESPMVRHECAEALGSIADDSCLPILRQYLDDPVQVVRESCQVALDMWEFERGVDMI